MEIYSPQVIEELNVSGSAVISGSLTISGSLSSTSVTITSGSINNTSIGGTTPSTGGFSNLSYTGTLTGGTGVVNLGSGQFIKDANGNVGIGTSSPQSDTTLTLGRSSTLTVAGNATVQVATQTDGRKVYLVSVTEAADSRRTSFGIWFSVAATGGQYIELANNDAGGSAKTHTLAADGTTLQITNTSGTEQQFQITLMCFGAP